MKPDSCQSRKVEIVPVHAERHRAVCRSNSEHASTSINASATSSDVLFAHMHAPVTSASSGTPWTMAVQHILSQHLPSLLGRSSHIVCTRSNGAFTRNRCACGPHGPVLSWGESAEMLKTKLWRAQGRCVCVLVGDPPTIKEDGGRGEIRA